MRSSGSVDGYGSLAEQAVGVRTIGASETNNRASQVNMGSIIPAHFVIGVTGIGGFGHYKTVQAIGTTNIEVAMRVNFHDTPVSKGIVAAIFPALVSIQ